MVRRSFGKDYVAISAELGELLHELIDFNGQKIYRSARAEGHKEQAEKAIEYLFQDLYNVLKKSNRFESDMDATKEYSPTKVYKVFRDFVRRDMKDVYKPEDPDELIVLDFVAGMTDSFAIRSISDIFIPELTV
jgi:dGTPase